MRFLNVFLLAFAAVSVSASCYHSGPKTNKGNIAPLVGTVCNYLQGNYGAKEERYQCAIDNSGVKWDFALRVSTPKPADAVPRIWDLKSLTSSQRISNGKNERPIGTAECQDGMNKEIACQYGGERYYYNWYYR